MCTDPITCFKGKNNPLPNKRKCRESCEYFSTKCPVTKNIIATQRHLQQDMTIKGVILKIYRQFSSSCVK